MAGQDPGDGPARLAEGLSRDIDAVRAALPLPWSNGPAEGQISRLKLLRRQMYGRAKFDLLRSRVLHAAWPRRWGAERRAPPNLHQKCG